MKLYNNGIPWPANSAHGLGDRPRKRDTERLAKYARKLATKPGKRTRRDAVRVPFRVMVDAGMETVESWLPYERLTERAILGYVDYVEAYPTDEQREQWACIADEAEAVAAQIEQGSLFEEVAA